MDQLVLGAAIAVGAIAVAVVVIDMVMASKKKKKPKTYESIMPRASRYEEEHSKRYDL